MKHYKRMKKLTLVLSRIILIASMPVYAVAEDEIDATPELNIQTTTEGIDNIYNEIHFYLGSEEHSEIDDMAELTQATQDLHEAKVETGVSTNARGITTTTTEAEEINLTLQFSSNYFATEEYKAFSRERASLDSIEEVRDFRSRLNAFSKQYHDALIAQNMPLLSDAEMEYNSVEVVGYSPYVVARIDADKVDAELLLSCAESNSVVSVCVEEEAVAEAAASNSSSEEDYVPWNTMLRKINAYDTVSNGTYTGEGIRIGIYDAAEICDVDVDALSGINITNRPYYTNINEDKKHATKVTAVVAAIAPDAEYYVGYGNERGLDWFIEQGCDIVNCSFGFYFDRPGNYLLSKDGLYDYQILAHFMVVVVSSGNYIALQTHDIPSPGHAFNAITVGGVKRVYADSQHQLEYDDGSCYISNIECKPNISAVMSIAHPDSKIRDLTGTSFAAPQVTGCIALMMERYPSICNYPEEILSVICLTVEKTYGFIDSELSHYDDKVGAGVINLQAIIDGYTYTSIDIDEQGGMGTEIHSEEYYFSLGDEVRVALAWTAFAMNFGTDSDPNIIGLCLTDYDIYVYSPSGMMVAYSNNRVGNIEIIRFTATEHGEYRIVVRQYSELDDYNEGDWLSLTFIPE